MAHTDLIPTLDVGGLEESDGRDREFSAALRQFGFCGIAGHGIDSGLIAGAYEAFQKFFALPLETKCSYFLPQAGGARGYTPFKRETAKDSKLADLKEFWHVGREFDRGTMLGQKYAAWMPPNVWPDEVPEFRSALLDMYWALDELGSRLLERLTPDLGLSRDWFADKTAFGNSILRPIHYPPIDPVDAALPRSGAHEDINLITLLVGASSAGLEVQTREGSWLALTPATDVIVVNVGDMLQRLTHHRYPSARHRVVNPTGLAATRPRFSVPFFVHPNPDFLIEALPNCVVANPQLPVPPAISAHDYLLQRLHEIQLL